MPGGVNWQLNEAWTTRLMWDGANLHPIVTHHFDTLSLSLMMLDGRDPTLAISFGF